MGGLLTVSDDAMSSNDIVPGRRESSFRALADIELALNAHSVERAIDEEHGDCEKRYCQQGRHMAIRTLRFAKVDRQLNSKQAEQRRELDDGIQRHRTGVLERIPDGIADNRRSVKLGSLCFQFCLHDLLRVVPRAAGVSHED